MKMLNNVLKILVQLQIGFLKNTEKLRLCDYYNKL